MLASLSIISLQEVLDEQIVYLRLLSESYIIERERNFIFYQSINFIEFISIFNFMNVVLTVPKEDEFIVRCTS
jgi:hypothetical protein